MTTASRNQVAYFSNVTRVVTLGPFIREKISRGLHKTRTPRINETKSTFAAYPGRGVYTRINSSFRVLCRPRLIFPRINGPIEQRLHYSRLFPPFVFVLIVYPVFVLKACFSISTIYIYCPYNKKKITR